MKCSRCNGPLLGGECLYCGHEAVRDEWVRKLIAKLGFNGDPRELVIGAKEEYREHAKTLNYSMFMAASIAIDHLNEDPHYYTKMQKMEARK